MQFELDNPFKKKYNIKLNYTIIKYEGVEYIISTTHNYPFINDNIKSILWNELLIIEKESISKKNIPELQYKIPDDKSFVILETENTIYELSIDESLTLMSFDGINNIYIPYITATFNEKIKNPELLRGLSGSPIFIINRYYDKKNNKVKHIKKIIGIFSQFNMHTNQAYIIPSYLIKKTLDKKDNLNVYTLPNIETTKKIGRFNISNGNIIFHHIFGNIPISTFLLIEGDADKDMIIQELEYPLSSKIIKENEFNIDKQKMETFYIVNSKLISILRKIKKYNIIKDILSNKLKKIKISL
jgi:hypothetical protein